MARGLALSETSCVATADAVLRALARVQAPSDLATLMEAVAREFGFRYFALIHHVDLRGAAGDYVHLMDYPTAAVERIIDRATWRRDPIIRACLFAGRAFLWSELPQLIDLDRRDRQCLTGAIGEGLNEGITVPYSVLGRPMGSCTFAGTKSTGSADRYLGVVQMIGVFAFQAALRLFGCKAAPARGPRLHPRPRDCVVLAGRGLSNKEIARALAITPRTVDGYLREARSLFDAHDRTELVVSALLAGEVHPSEMRCRAGA
jgi:DNA-binding CsgD family transcriptional regulator